MGNFFLSHLPNLSFGGARAPKQFRKFRKCSDAVYGETKKKKTIAVCSTRRILWVLALSRGHFTYEP